MKLVVLKVGEGKSQILQFKRKQINNEITRINRIEWLTLLLIIAYTPAAQSTNRLTNN
jgi:hypothetical protein